MKIEAGTVLNQRYEIRQALGEGGFASVYLAWDLQLARELALKVLKIGVEAQTVERFQREAKLLGKLLHKNIVQVYSFDLLDDNTPFISMELLQGSSLHSRLVTGPALSEEQITRILTQSCEALEYAHNSGVIHRDLSPANIFLIFEKGELQVKLLDFGLSKVYSEQDSAKSTLTETGVVIGNPSYMSPEHARGAAASAQSDIYSLACVLYHCLTGREPFQADSAVGYIYKHLNDYPAEPKLNWSNSEREGLLKAITLRCLQKDPAKRFRSCQELLQVLADGVMADGSPVGKGLSSWADSSATKKKHPILLKIALTLILCLACVQCLISFDLPGKRQAISAVYRNLASFYKQSGDQEKEASCLLDLARLDLKSANTMQFAEEISQVLKIAESYSDDSKKAELLSTVWNLLQPEMEKHPEAALQRLEVEIFSQMINSRRQSKGELRRAFNELIRKDRLPAYPKAQTQVLSAYLERNRPVLTMDEISGLDYIAEHCPVEDAVLFWRTRVKVASRTGEKRFRVMFGLADIIASSHPKEAIEMIHSSRMDECDAFDYARSWLKEAQIEKEYFHNDKAALAGCTEGLRILNSCPLITYHSSRNRKPLLVRLKIEELYSLHQTAELERFSSEALTELFANRPKLEDSLEEQDMVDSSIMKTVGNTGRNYPEHIAFYERDGLYPFILCFLQTQQPEKARKVLSFFLDRLKTEEWHLDQKVREGLKESLPEVQDLQSKALIAEILESKEVILPKRFNIPD